MPHNENFSTLFELLPIGAYRSEPTGRQVRANRAMVRLFGFEAESDMLDSLESGAGGWYVQPGRRAVFRALLESEGTVRHFDSEMRRHQSGEVFWISENAHTVRDGNGAVLYYEGTVEDITDRKLAENALQLTLDNAGRGLAKIDARGVIVLYNRHLLELLDLPESLLAARPLLQEVVAYQKARGDFGVQYEFLNADPLQSIYGKPMVGNNATLLGNGTYLRRTSNGRVLEISTQPLPDGGKVRTFSDVTAYFNTQAALAEKTRALQVTMDSMSQGISTIDASGRTLTSNRRHQELLGFPEALMATHPTMETLVRLQVERGDFGENFSYVDALARGYVAVGGQMPASQGPETYIRKTRDGLVLEVKTRPLPDGGVVRTFTDITAATQAQEALAHK